MLREVATKVNAKVETNVKAKVAEEAPIQVALQVGARWPRKSKRGQEA